MIKIMQTILSAFQQGYREIWQDKRTLWARLILPLLLLAFGLWILTMSLSSGASSEDNANTTAQVTTPAKSRVALVDNNQGEALIKQLKLRKDIEWITRDSADNLEAEIEMDSFDMAIVIDEYFDDALKNDRTGEVLIYYNLFTQETQESLMDNIKWYENQLLRKRLDSLNLSEDLTDPINISGIQTQSLSESGSSALSGIGSFFILFIFFYGWLGVIYPALTLFTAESINPLSILERDKGSVFTGRWLAVISMGWIYSGLFLGILYLLVHVNSGFKGMYAGIAQASFDTSMLGWVFLNLIPLVILFGSFVSWSVLKNSTFKESQNKLQPLKITIFVLLLMGVTQSFGFNYLTSIVPVLGSGSVSIAMLEGETSYVHLLLVIGCLVGLSYLLWQAGFNIFKEKVKTQDDTFLAN